MSLSLTIKKESPVIFHLEGVPIAIVELPDNARHSQARLAFTAGSSLQIDREEVFQRRFPGVDYRKQINLAKKGEAA